MYEYFIGVIKECINEQILFEINNKAYLFSGVNLSSLEKNKILKVYVYLLEKQEKKQYYAFKDYDTKKVFVHLISINSVGPNSALKILNAFSLQEFKAIVETKNYYQLQKCKGINKKVAFNIINYFNIKTKKEFNFVNQDKYLLVYETLIKLGFIEEKINTYAASVDWSIDVEEIINIFLKEQK